MLELKGLESYYGESRVVNGVDLSVADGNIVCLIGRNGVGKSTLLKSIMGLVRSKGTISFDGQEIMKMPTYNRTRLGIGYVPQGREIFPQMTVQENLELGMRAIHGKAKLPDYIYELFPVLPKFAKRKGGDLSGGQQQQLAIARALACEPRLLILDEPTEGIQPSIIQDIGVAIRRINAEKGVTVLMVEQYLEFVLDISQYLYVMEKGEIVLEGETAKLDVDKIQRIMTE
ncbi:MAG: urea ABC transporter ATP-binding subunit UrtE [Coriobacteriales bacterium]|jgi:urea transport system ATP-binding protein|nr:urea ABC transporter ATP-binding subunit UrtE [Coriobacteriales bacterium]